MSFAVGKLATTLLASELPSAASAGGPSRASISTHRLRAAEGERPGSCAAMRPHLLPCVATLSRKISSSAVVHSSPLPIFRFCGFSSRSWLGSGVRLGLEG